MMARATINLCQRANAQDLLLLLHLRNGSGGSGESGRPMKNPGSTTPTFRIRVKWRSAQHRSRLDFHLHIYINDYESGGGHPCRDFESQIRQGAGGIMWKASSPLLGRLRSQPSECGVEYGGRE